MLRLMKGNMVRGTGLFMLLQALKYAYSRDDEGPDPVRRNFPRQL